MNSDGQESHRHLQVLLFLPAVTLFLLALAHRLGAVDALYSTVGSRHQALSNWLLFDAPALGWGLLTLVCTSILWLADYDWSKPRWTLLAIKLVQLPFLALLLGGISILVTLPFIAVLMSLRFR